jgi:hypothetical protein
LRAAAAKLNGIGNVEHISAHPERLKDGRNWHSWTTNEKGIYLADLLAGGDFRSFFEITKGSDAILIPEGNITESCARLAGYALYHNNRPFLGTPQALRDKHNIHKYIMHRDFYSRHDTTNGKEYWGNSSFELAASLCKHDCRSIAQLTARERYMWDKRYTGANQYYYGMLDDETRKLCRFCTQKMDTLSHQIAECRQVDVSNLREDALANYELSTNDYRSGPCKDTKIAKALDIYKEILLKSNSGLAWLGMWCGEHAISLNKAFTTMTLNQHQYNMLHKTLKKLHHDAIKIPPKHEMVKAEREEHEDRLRHRAANPNMGQNNNRLYQPLPSELSSKQIEAIMRRRKRIRKLKAIELLGDEELEDRLKKRKTVEVAGDPNAEDTYKQIIAFDPLDKGVTMGAPNIPNTYLRQLAYKDWKKRKKKA